MLLIPWSLDERMRQHMIGVCIVSFVIYRTHNNLRRFTQIYVARTLN